MARHQSVGLAWDLREFGAVFRRHPIGPLVGFASFVVSAVSGAWGRPVGLPFWAWLELGEAAVVVSLIQEIRSQRVMDPDHAATIKRIAESVHDSVASGGVARYRDQGREDAHVRVLFHSHCPELSDSLKEWDSLCLNEPGAQQKAMQAIYDNAWSMWFSREGGWYTGPIIKHAQEFVQRGIDRDPNIPNEPQFVVRDNLVTQGNHGRGSVIHELDGDDILNGGRYVDQLKSWVLDTNNLQEVEDWRRQRVRRAQVQEHLTRELQLIMYASSLSRSRCGADCRAY